MDQEQCCIELQSGDRQISVSRYGGRILGFSIEGRNALLDTGIQTGSTFWPSPQSLWGWPPPPELDEHLYDVLGATNTSVLLRSQPCAALGIQLYKRITASSHGFNVSYTIENVSDEIVTMAPWEISRIAGGLTFYSADTGPEGFSTCAVDFAVDHYWYRYCPEGLVGIPKIFSNNSGGWIANANNGLLLIKKFPSVDPQEIAPREAEIEIYAHADVKNPYIEVEQQGPFTAIMSGRRLEWGVEWALYQLPESLDVSVGSEPLLDFVESTFAQVETP